MSTRTTTWGVVNHERVEATLSVALTKVDGINERVLPIPFDSGSIHPTVTSQDAQISVDGQDQNNPQAVNGQGSVPQPWRLKAHALSVDPGVTISLPIVAGYTPRDLSCVRRAPAGNEVGRFVVPASAMNVASGSVTVTMPTLHLDANIDCVQTYVKDAGAAQWEVVDAGDLNAHLAGSQWEFSVAGQPAVTVADCGDATTCVDGRDVDPRPGFVRVLGLENAQYELVEVVAPAGFEIPANGRRSFGVDALNRDVNVGHFAHSPRVGPAIPLTGGAAADVFVVGGMPVMVASLLLAVALTGRRAKHAPLWPTGSPVVAG